MNLATDDLYLEILDIEASLPVTPDEPWSPDWAVSMGSLVIEVMEGTPGPQGPPGSGTSVTLTQSTPSNSWVFAHGMGLYPSIEVFVGGIRHYPSIDYVLDSATITFPTATTGVAIARR